MLFETLLLVYAAAVGFAAAGLAGSFYELLTARPPGFPNPRARLPALLAALAACAVTGPFIVARMLAAEWRAKRSSFGWSIAGVAVACLWSGCSGIVLLQLAVALGRGPA